MDINYELYKVFYHVAKELSFSTAAEHLYISQSAVSQAIRSLEQKLSCRLFVRNTKKVRLTQEGEILFKHVQQAFNFLKAGERSIQDVHSLKQGEVRIGASDTICKYLLMPYFQEFHRLYPNIKIHITNRTSPICLELVKAGHVDVSIINVPRSGADKDVHLEPLKAIQDVFIAGSRFQHLLGKEMTYCDLADYPLLMLEKHTSTREFIDEFMESKSVKLIPEIELGSVELLVEMAKIGLGISFVVEDYLIEELKKGDIFTLKLKDPTPPRQIGIATKTNIPLPPAAQKFIQLLTGNNERQTDQR